MPRDVRLLPVALPTLAACAPALDCGQGKTLFEAAGRETDPKARIALLTRSPALCPDPLALGDLAQAHLAAGGLDPALAARRAASESRDDPAQQVRTRAPMAHVYLRQDRLGAAIGAIGAAFDRARAPVPGWV